MLSRITEVMQKGKNCMLSGLDGTCKSFVIKEIINQLGGKLIYIAADEESAYDSARTLQAMLGKEHVCHLPARDLLAPGQSVHSPVNVERLTFLSEIRRHPGRPAVLVMSIPAVMFETIPAEIYKDLSENLKSGQKLEVERFLSRLVTMGYTRQPTVESPGQFAVRGGVIDVFAVQEHDPIRLELFGDEIESVRSFSAQTQRSLKTLKSVSITPADEGSGNGRVWEYFAENWPVWMDEPLRSRETWALHSRRHKKFLQDIDKRHPVPQTIDIKEFEQFVQSRPVLYHSFFPQTLAEGRVEFMEHFSQRETEPFWARPGELMSKVKDWLGRGWRVIFAVPDRAGQESIRRSLGDSGVQGIEFVNWRMDKGFESSTLKIALISERDIKGRTGGRQAPAHKAAEHLTIDELGIGDFVVHENHGIGMFKGITGMEVDGIRREYLLIQYAGTDRVYLPMDKLAMLTKYSSGEGREPKLNKLGGTEWERTKKRVRESIQEMAEELLALYAARDKSQGHAYSPDTVWQHEFEDAFEYVETPDQARAAIDVKKDMERSRPMDRLVCGDVGYGKTEVAMRATFKAVMDHKQVAVLVPTTILAEQHFQTFSKRLEAYPAVIEVLSRFRTAGQQKKILEDLKKGTVDIIIGTHRLLSKDVTFKDLGLLVIDEEHRFGVRQKERIKALKQVVDVVSLSATPIPRTLHMALTGLRDLSVIETPPPNRYPINTYVMEYNPEIIGDAIKAEIDRQGQVFYVHNRINDIERVKREVEALIPEIRLDVAHGRMSEDQLARVIKRFMAGESDVLLCTTIIESGLDMPRVNTMIVDEADRMGLAQLYQLRGRIGRSDRVAYAYLTYRPDRIVSETAQKRLNAIREFTELGSGMKIALRDLEIRGGGNILGPEQHGYIEAVGFDMYCRLLEEETARSRGDIKPRRELPQMEIKIDSYIPDDYINDPGIKVQIYRQAMMISSVKEVNDMEKELEDRFGTLPLPTQNFLRISRLRVLAMDKKIKYINTDAKQIELNLERPLGDKVGGLVDLRDKYGFEISVSNQNTLVLKSYGGLSLEALEDLLNVI